MWPLDKRLFEGRGCRAAWDSSTFSRAPFPQPVLGGGPSAQVPVAATRQGRVPEQNAID